jgi:hypothetical protein
MGGLSLARRAVAGMVGCRLNTVSNPLCEENRGMNQTGAPASGDPAVNTLQDHLAALQMLRRIRTVLVALLLLSLLVPIAVFVLVETGYIPSGSSAGEHDGFQPLRVSEAALRLAPIVAHGAALLLLLVYLLSVNVCLVGRLGSGRDAMAAFFWMVLVLVLLGAWAPQVLDASLPRAFFSLDSLRSATAELTLTEDGGPLPVTWTQLAMHWARFIGLAVLGAVAVVVADMRFGRTYTLAIRRLRDRMGISVRV